tara:strand:+ start:3142 stop:3249 length:108 start_codon:yes stop_codon:yes gene_type:complete
MVGLQAEVGEGDSAAMINARVETLATLKYYSAAFQ